MIHTMTCIIRRSFVFSDASLYMNKIGHVARVTNVQRGYSIPTDTTASLATDDGPSGLRPALARPTFACSAVAFFRIAAVTPGVTGEVMLSPFSSTRNLTVFEFHPFSFKVASRVQSLPGPMCDALYALSSSGTLDLRRTVPAPGDVDAGDGVNGDSTTLPSRSS